MTSPRSGASAESTAIEPGLQHAVGIIQAVCRLAGAPLLVNEIRADLQSEGILGAVDRHDSAALFDWLIAGLSFQGVSDRIASDYMDRHGQATWADIHRSLANTPSCPKLTSYWHFHNCGYQKGSGTCAEPEHLPACPLPAQRLRNGRLNQTAYSLFLFIRDIAGGDLVAWIDGRLAGFDGSTTPTRLAQLREGLLGPLRHVYGVSDKVLAVTRRATWTLPC